MDDNKEKELMNETMMLELIKRSNAIISFVGFSFILLGAINSFNEIPNEYVLSITFSAFFFVLADYISVSSPLTKTKINFHTIFLFFGVFSFIGIPALLFIYPDQLDYLLNSSESFSIFSLGMVLVMINMKIWDSEKNLHNKIIKASQDAGNLFSKLEEYINESQVEINNLKEENEKLKSELYKAEKE